VTRLDAILGVSVVASLVTNLVLFVRRGSAETSTIDADAAVATVPCPKAAPPPPHVQVPGVDPQTPCEPQAVTLHAKLIEAERFYTSRLSPSVRFERGTPNPEAETTLKAYLAEHAFVDVPDDLAYTVECRSLVCKIEVDTQDTEFDLAERVRDAPLHGIGGEGMQVGGRKVYIVSHERGRADGMRVVFAILEEYATSLAVGECKLRHPSPPGKYTVIFNISPTTGTVAVVEKGNLVGTPAATCLREVLDRVIERHPVPNGAEPWTEPVPWTVQIP
jgi:hypothetical protein